MEYIPAPIKVGVNGIASHANAQIHQAQNSTVYASLKKGTQKVAEFIAREWTIILAHFVALTAIVLAATWMHGWDNVGMPLTISISAGLGAGVIIAILINSFAEKRQSILEFLQENLLQKLDQEFLRYVLVSFLVASLIHAIPYVPQLGALIGLIDGNHMVGHRPWPDPHPPAPTPSPTPAPAITPLQTQIDSLTKELAKLREEMNNKNIGNQPAPAPTHSRDSSLNSSSHPFPTWS